MFFFCLSSEGDSPPRGLQSRDSVTEELDGRGGVPLDLFGSGTENRLQTRQKTQNRDGHVRQRRENRSQTRTARPMPILVPPTVFDKMQAIFHLPVTAYETQKIKQRHLRRVQTRHIISALLKKNLAVREIVPKTTHFIDAPFFSTVSTFAGPIRESSKQESRASTAPG